MKVLLFLICLSFIVQNHGLRIPGFISGMPMGYYQEKLPYSETDAEDCSFVKVNTTTAKVDNFDPNNTETWQQVRYF